MRQMASSAARPNLAVQYPSLGKAASRAFWSILSLKKLQFSVKVLQIPSLETQITFEQHRTV